MIRINITNPSILFGEFLYLGIPINGYLAELGELLVAQLSDLEDGALSDICEQTKEQVPLDEATIETYVSTENMIANKGGVQASSGLPNAGKVVRYRQGDTLIANIRPYFKKIWYAPYNGTCSGDVLVFRPIDKTKSAILYFLLHQDEFFDFVMLGAKGTKMPRGDKVQMMKFPVPTRFNGSILALTRNLVKEISARNHESTQLSRLRDTLLPKLMSGEIDVSTIELPNQINSHLAASNNIRHYCSSKDNCSIGNREKGKPMEIEIDEVLLQMQPALSCHQLKLLEEVLVGAIKREASPNTQNEEQQLLALFLTAKKVEGCSANTIEYYGNTLKQMNSVISKPYTQINSDDLRRYLNDYERNRNSSKVTIDNIRRIMSSFFSWLEDENYIVKSQVRRIHKVKAPVKAKDVIRDEDLEALRDACTTKRDLAIIDILASTGIRVGELVKLNIADVNLQERECLVTGKGNKQRIVYFDARTKLHLRAYLQDRSDSSKALFVALGTKGKRIGIDGVEKRLKGIGKRAGVQNIHPHKFRRTLATYAIDKGMPIEQVQKLLGHAKIETTMHYALVDQGNVKSSHRRYLE